MNRQIGFTLVEMMIAIVIVAILATVAIPAYQDQVRKGRRADGESILLDVALQQERFFTKNGIYTINMNDLGYAGNATWVKSPDRNYRVRVQTTANCQLTNCYRLLGKTLNTAQSADGNMRLWSSGRKQRVVGGGWQEGWE